MIKEINLVIVFILAIYSPNGGPKVSWYYLGSARTNYSLTVNTGSALVLGCLAKAQNKFPGSATGLVSPAFAITKGSAPTVATTDASTTAGAIKTFGFTPSGGTNVWDSVNGNSAGFDHILAIVSIPPPPSYGAASGMPPSGYLQMYIPSLTTSDAGFYYCTFYDGTAAATAATAATTNYASSSYFSLTMTTKSGSGSSKNAQRNKAFEYSIALLGASKLLF